MSAVEFASELKHKFWFILGMCQAYAVLLLLQCWNYGLCQTKLVNLSCRESIIITTGKKHHQIESAPVKTRFGLGVGCLGWESSTPALTRCRHTSGHSLPPWLLAGAGCNMIPPCRKIITKKTQCCRATTSWPKSLVLLEFQSLRLRANFGVSSMLEVYFDI